MRVLLTIGTAIATLAIWPRLAAPQSAGLAHTASRVTDMREMAMFHNSNVYLWIRATDEGTVLVYASSGFRNAFAQPVTLTADEADRWAALAEPLMADSLRVTAMRRERLDTTSTRDQLAFGDFVLLSRPHMDPPTLTVKIGELSPNAVTTTFFAPALGPVVPAIREAARAAREMAASRAADSTARVATLEAATAPPQATVAQTAAGPTGTGSPSAAAPTPPVTPASPRETVIAAVAPPTVPLAPALPPPSPAESPEPMPTVPASPIAQPWVAPSSAAPTAAIATPTVTAAPSVAVATAVVPAVEARSLPTMMPPTATAPAPNVSQRLVPPAATVRVSAPATTPSSPTVAAAPALVRDTARPATARATTVNVRIPPHPTTVAIVATTTPVIPPPPAPSASRSTGLSADSSAAVEGGLSDDEFSTETHRRESSMMACYAQYGLSINPSLRGHITVRISLSDSGEVMRATVVDRSWSAAAPTDVESCIVHRVFVWHFPVARRSSIHDYSVTFGH